MSLTKITPEIVEDSIQPVGFKNKIIGGDFSINPWQRGTSFAAVADLAYTADRWQNQESSEAIYTITKTADAPTVAEAGVFTQHCLHVDVTTADATLAAGQYGFINQKIEGFNSASFGFGQAGVRKITLSFWVKATKTGVYCVSFVNSAGNRSYVAEYTVSVTDTWEKKSITLDVDTTGTWLYDTGIGLAVRFALAAGTTFQGSANTWIAGNILATVNQVNALDSVDNNFKLALVQLEAGENASRFEARSVGQESVLCERYYQKISGTLQFVASGASQSFGVPLAFRTATRTIPTLAYFEAASQSVSVSGTPSIVAHNEFYGRIVVISAAAATTAYIRTIEVSAEL